MRVRLTHIDGKLPNLALMKLARWHRDRGDEVHFTRDLRRGLFEPDFDAVYGSCIFSFSRDRIETLRREFPTATIGGTGSGINETVETLIGQDYERYDYSVYPDFKYSIGLTQRGCRLKCKFCVVPEKEGKPRSINSVYDIWREGTERNLHLLDNDFFGQPKEELQARINEIISGGFKVCFNQGINIRLIDDDAAHWLAQMRYYDDSFTYRRLYTAWDNLGDEKLFFRGVDTLERAGIPPNHLMVYMLVGYAKNETWEQIFHRFNKMVERKIRPYPMVYDASRKDLKRFQRWVIRKYYEFIPWDEFKNGYHGPMADGAQEAFA